MPFQRRFLAGRAFQVFVPAGEGPFPCVVFLHGVGENGTDGEKHLAVGLPPYVLAHERDFPAVVIAPQCKGSWMYVGDDERLVMGALEATGREVRLQRERIYLTGLSQGGCSALDLGAKHPEVWAALVVICGAGRIADAMRLRRTPIRLYHGEKDEVIPPSGHHKFDDETVGGRDLSKVLPHAAYVEFPGADHFIWDRVYGDPAMWEWLFAQKRP